MKQSKESKEDRFRRLAEARVNKIIAMIRLLDNLSSRSIYTYTQEQVEQIFTALQLELTRAKTRFLQSPGQGRRRFSPVRSMRTMLVWLLTMRRRQVLPWP